MGMDNGRGVAGDPLRLDMKIRNFGPIKRASISIRPFTIFIGPTNTGKSYASMLAHSIISSANGTAARFAAQGDRPGKVHNQEGALRDIRGALLNAKPGETVGCTQRLEAQITRSCERRFAEGMQGEVERNFGVPLDKLGRFKSNRPFVSLESGGRRILTHGSRGTRLGCMRDLNIRFELKGHGRREVRVARSSDGIITCIVHRDLLADDDMARMRGVYEKLEREVIRGVVSRMPAACRYFPAGRAGILQSEAVPPRATVGVTDGDAAKARMPRLPGAALDLVSVMSEMRPRRGQYHKIGEQIEKDLFGGRISLGSSPGGEPEPVYRHRLGASVPMSRVSSTISELAPLTLHLKYGIKKGDMVVVEEPEAHLHPRSQIQLARHLVRLVRGGINVMITTHSAVLLEVASQCLIACRMSPRDRRHVLGAEDVYLNMGEVAPHVFRLDGDGAGIVEKIPMSTDDGIYQDEFIEVDQRLNIDGIRIEERLN